MQVIEIVVWQSACNQKLNDAGSVLGELAGAALNADTVEVDATGNKIDADVLNSPALVVSCKDIEVGVAITVGILILAESNVLASFALGEDSIELFLLPNEIGVNGALGNCNSSIEVDDHILSGTAHVLIVEVGLLGDLEPTARVAVLVEVGNTSDVLISTASSVAASLSTNE